jgi:hypothetical protein
LQVVEVVVLIVLQELVEQVVLVAVEQVVIELQVVDK